MYIFNLHKLHIQPNQCSAQDVAFFIFTTLSWPVYQYIFMCWVRWLNLDDVTVGCTMYMDLQNGWSFRVLRYVLRQTTLLGLTKRQGDFTGMHTHAYVFLAQWTSRLLIWTVLNTPGSCGLLISSCCFKFPSPPPRILSPPHSDMQIIALLLSSLSAIFVFRRLWAWWEAVRAIR